MAVKQLPGSYAPDGSRYITFTDGAGNLVSITSSATGTTKQLPGFRAPDGGDYVCITDGAGNLV